ncbi:hypothetical protein [Futiania mangrovi]|uniref:Uncharacterized protein n=1 Tax=Futiania mangrovi TaxID=2959716 RepID=A0A9J6PEH0_9PROT|nr:hypothetical protein [Futiania mangrovii]MCP1336806.1 hypothetical protein [Futiania mangrovii]
MVDAVAGIGTGAGGMTRVDYLEHMLTQGPQASTGGNSAIDRAARGGIDFMVGNQRVMRDARDFDPASLHLSQGPGSSDRMTAELGQLDPNREIRAATDARSAPNAEVTGQALLDRAQSNFSRYVTFMDRINTYNNAVTGLELANSAVSNARTSLETLLRG